MTRWWHWAWWPERPRYCFAAALASILVAFLYSARADGRTAFDPPSQARAQRIIGDAYDDVLRVRYPRSGITTRCRGRRHLLCSVHVRRRGVELYWQMTRVNLEKGEVRTSLDGALEGVIRVPGKPLMYRSEAL